MPAGESEARAKTRARFDEVFKKYTDLPSERKKVKKKSPQPPESIVLQTLRNNLDLGKDIEDNETTLQNTYLPDQGSLRFSKNKRREREVAEKVNVNNNGNQEEVQPTPKVKRRGNRELPPAPRHDDASSYVIQIEGNDDDGAANAKGASSEARSETDDLEKGQKRKSKRGRRRGEEEAASEGREVEAEDQLIQEYQQQIAQEEERAVKTTTSASQEVVLNNEVGKKKKKKKQLRSLDTTDKDTSVVSNVQHSQSDEVIEMKRPVDRTSSDNRGQNEDLEMDLKADTTQTKGLSLIHI